ncbi:MAG: hemerythrin domain-containing protein [Flavobacteriaceae bacterium]|nr:hemerythrin domain-containing protein [Flavobacteriaceae bacterium]
MEGMNSVIRQDMKMSEILLRNHSLILILERFSIELGVKEKTISDICEESNVNTDVFLFIFNLHNDISYLSKSSFQKLDIRVIISYLRKSHIYYTLEVFPEIIKNIRGMTTSNKKPENLMLERFFEEYKKEVDEHFAYENNIAFPYILSLLDVGNKTKNQTNYTISEYKEHHDNLEEKLDDLKRLLIQYLPPQNDSVMRRKLLVSLCNFEKDLMVHAMIEDNILVPLVEKLEKKNS